MNRKWLDHFAISSGEDPVGYARGRWTKGAIFEQSVDHDSDDSIDLRGS